MHDDDTSSEHYEDDDFEFGKSKSQIKREMTALQDLGRKLTELNAEQFKTVPVSEDLKHAIETYLRIRQKEARRRQLQFIGKLMRSEDSEAIQEAVDLFDASSQRYAKVLHELEAWRTRLIEEGNTAITEFVEAFPAVDVQHLRQLVRNAQKDQSHGKNTGAAKKLFQYLRQISAPSP